MAGLSYSDSGVSASIRVSATVSQPLGFSSVSWPNIENQPSVLEYDFNDQKKQLLIRIPKYESAVCIIELADGKQLYYSVSEDLFPVAVINTDSDNIPVISQITIIYTEN